MAKVADPMRKDDRHYTYRDYASWPDDERWELIDGVAYSMSPAPGTAHQRTTGGLFAEIYTWLKEHGGPCEAFVAPCDVFLPNDPSEADDDVDTVVQPDVMVVCDPAKITPRGCRGAPDLVVEVLSPWTSHKDQLVKHALYARHGVREYWVIDPGNRCVRVYRPEPSVSPPRFGEPAILHEKGRVESAVLLGYGIPVAELFARLG
jgi:Uma2 family endonuclease